MPDWWQMFDGPEAAQMQRPPPVSDSGHAAGYGAAMAGSYIDDPIVRARFFAQRRGIPLSRYRIVQGRPVYRADDGKEYFEEPDFAPLSDPGSAVSATVRLVGPATAVVPPVAVGLATSPLMLAGPGGLVASMSATGAAAAGGQYVKEQIGNLFAGEPQKGTASRMVSAAGANALGQGIGAGLNAVLGRVAAVDINRLDRPAVAGLQRKATREGIDLNPAQLTNLDSLKAQHRLLANMPASAGIMREGADRQAGQVAGRVGDLLDSYSLQDSGEIAGRNLKEAALIAIEEAKNIRASAAQPFYDAAKSSGAHVDSRPILGYIDRELRSAKGATRSALQKARSYMFAPDGSLDTSVSGLHSAKLALDDLLNGLEPDVGVISPGGSKSTSFRDITKIKDALVQTLSNASPDYAQGLQAFRAASAPVDQLQGGLVGLLARTDDARAHKALLGLFDPSKAGPRAVAEARVALSRVDPEAWQQAKRAFMQDAWDRASKEFASAAQGGAIPAGAKFRALLLGDKRQQDVLRSALSPSEFNAISDLGDVLEATGRVRLSGSETAWNTDVLQRTADEARPMVMRIIRNLNPAQFLRSFDETVTNWAMQGKLTRLAEVYNSPDAMRRLKELRLASPATQRGRTLLVQLAADFGEDFARDMLAPSVDAVPPRLGQAQPQEEPRTAAPPASPRRSWSELLDQQP